MTTETQSNLTIRYMQVPDIQQVMYIDGESFKPPWPERSYRFEINESQISYMVVLEKVEERPVSGVRRLLNNLRGTDPETEQKSIIVAYGGLWKAADEAHISTIASHPDYRGNKYGEVVLASMLKRAIVLKAGYIVLEVRVSNTIAQTLYKKYGFIIYGVKKNYYHHDKEDAYDMRIDLTPENIDHINATINQLQSKIDYRDLYGTTPHPRLGHE